MRIPFILGLVTALSLSMPLQAKQPEAPHLDPIVEQMQLNREQAARLKELVQQHHMKMRSMHQQRERERMRQRSEMFELRQQHREALLSVLSYEQLYHFEDYMRQQHRERRAMRQDAIQAE